jgi:hypothetical protein
MKRTVREMIYGSSMVRTKSRILLAVQEDPDDAALSILTGNKNNTGASKAEGLVYGVTLQELEVDGGARQGFPVIEWLEEQDHRTADEVAAELVEKVKDAGKESKKRRKQKVDDWIMFLSQQIQPGGKVQVTDIEAEARKAGLLRPGSLIKDSRPVEHAVKQLGIEKHQGSPDGGGHAVSFWFRPETDDVTAENEKPQ